MRRALLPDPPYHLRRRPQVDCEAPITPLLSIQTPYHLAGGFGSLKGGFSSPAPVRPALAPARHPPSRPRLHGEPTSSRDPPPDRTRPARASRPPPISREFLPVTRAHFAVLKCTHHLAHLDVETPRSLLRTAAHLSTLLHPAFPSDSFKRKSSRVADSWLSHALEALREHYSETTDAALSTIRSSPIPAALLEVSLSLAKRWAANQLGKKLTSSSVTAAFALIKDNQAILAPNNHALPPLPCSVATQTEASPHQDAQPVGEPLSPRAVAPPVGDLTAQTSPSPCETPAALIPPEPSTSPRPSTSTAEPRPQRQPRPRKRQRSLSGIQTDLMGNRIEPPPQRPASLPRPLTVPSWQSTVIFGDSNYSEFSMPATTVLAHANGRLSHYKFLLTSLRDPFPTVTKFALCLSSLDKDNASSTNISALKSALGAAHRVFPNASLSVQLAGIADDFSEAQRNGLQTLNSFVLNKAPSSCKHIPAATNFTVNNHLWTRSTRDETYKTLRDFLG